MYICDCKPLLTRKISLIYFSTDKPLKMCSGSLGVLSFIHYKIMNYFEQIRHPKWQKKRLKIMERDNFTCFYCKDTETTLNVHHKKYTGNAWEAPDEDLITLCEDCHTNIKAIEGIINSDKTNCIKVLKSKQKDYLSYSLILGDCEIGKGVIFYDVHYPKGLCFIRKENLEEILNEIDSSN